MLSPYRANSVLSDKSNMSESIGEYVEYDNKSRYERKETGEWVGEKGSWKKRLMHHENKLSTQNRLLRHVIRTGKAPGS